ncbi:MAG: amidohydrolase family protein, partial [Candidatus Marinimicrobia bacterium]|nr:amidohydrolase family protein [Candidatus Neomarinimicrobiota bacterium]
DTGMGISHCPSSNMRLGSGIARIHEMIDAGANVSLAVDGSASNDSSNMLIELRNALLLSHLRSRENWLTVDDILWMATRGGAAVLGRDDIGQIAPGKCADINLISIDRLEYSGGQHDPLAAIIFSVSMNPVDWVIVNGKVVVAEGKLKDIEEHSLIQKHQRISNQMVKDAEQRTGKQLTRPRL